jgi:hypothetical protein
MHKKITQNIISIAPLGLKIMKFLLFGPSYKGLSNTIKSAPQLIYPSLKSGFQFH